MENETSDAEVPIVERHKEIDLIQSCINRMAAKLLSGQGVDSCTVCGDSGVAPRKS